MTETENVEVFEVKFRLRFGQIKKIIVLISEGVCKEY
jgi:hypothetical protein